MENSEAQKGYCEGDICPNLNKLIRTLIIKTKKYVVFLDDEFYVQWAEFDTNEYTDNYCEVMNRVSYLETISTTHFAGVESKSNELAEFRRLLGEAVARVYERDGDSVGSSAISILNQAEQLLIDRSVQRARIWYLLAAATTAIFPACCLIVLWLLRSYFRSALGIQGFDVTTCACLGGIGALISTVIRVRKVNLNSSAGKTIHYIEGAARITVGIVAGALVVLAVKSNIVLGLINSSHDTINFSFLTFVAILSGASEQVVPNLIKQIETKTSFEDTKIVGK